MLQLTDRENVIIFLSYIPFFGGAWGGFGLLRVLMSN
jgi:hypothetical protein